MLLVMKEDVTEREQAQTGIGKGGNQKKEKNSDKGAT